MTEDEDYDALSQKQLASIKRDMRISLEDAAVRATHKVMAEFEALAQPEQQAEPTCPDCKAAVLYECVACSSNNYPPQQQAEPPPEWLLIKNILDEYGLQAISFVADWKAAQRKPLTDKQILADETLRYYFGQNGGAGPVSKQGKRVVNAIEAAHGIKETKK